tara:strand:+ start:2766 stop:3575 length:810 start_codon:yes stop_codon:yes gene_type:complete
MEEIQNTLSSDNNFNAEAQFTEIESNNFHLDLNGFDGPIDLLLELAKKQKVDLLEVSVLDLAEQYISYIENAKRLNLEIAAEYLVMAAWIAFLKSKILLPEEELEGVSSEELSEALAFQLKRLDAMRNAGKKLFELELLNKNRFCRGVDIEETRIVNFEDNTTLTDLIISYSSVIRSQNLSNYVPQLKKLETIESALNRLNKMLKQEHNWKQLSLFLPEGLNINNSIFDCSVLAATFSASLELVRTGDIELKQSVPFGDIFIRSKNEEN